MKNKVEFTLSESRFYKNISDLPDILFIWWLNLVFHVIENQIFVMKEYYFGAH